MKWLFISEICGLTGGIEVYAMRAAKALRASGDTVTLAYLTTGPMESEARAGYDAAVPLEEALQQDFDAVKVHKLRPVNLLERVAKQFGSRVLVMIHDHDPICARSYHYLPGKARRACPYAYSPLRCTLCGLARHPRNYLGASPWTQLAEGLFGIRRRIACLRGLKLLTNSHFMADELARSGLPGAKILAPFMAMPTVPARQRAKTFRWLFVGQLIRGKGVDLLLEAVATLPGDWTLTIVGDGNDRAWLEDLARGNDRVHFAGRVSDTAPYFTQADGVVFPSRWDEPFGMALMEAGAWGLPSVAFDVGGVRDIVDAGKTALLVPSRDTAAFATAMAQIMTANEPEAMGRAARAFVETRFSEELFLQTLRSYR